VKTSKTFFYFNLLQYTPLGICFLIKSFGDARI
jgi:hypothetical protein